jgi:hypothetical protein
MKKFQMWEFSFISKNTDRSINVLTGTHKEDDTEVMIPCFNGMAYFKVERGNQTHYYCIKYPKIQALSNKQLEEIEYYCGYMPESGEYGVICGALGICIEVSKIIYDINRKIYPLPRRLEY